MEVLQSPCDHEGQAKRTAGKQVLHEGSLESSPEVHGHAAGCLRISPRQTRTFQRQFWETRLPAWHGPNAGLRGHEAQRAGPLDEKAADVVSPGTAPKTTAANLTERFPVPGRPPSRPPPSGVGGGWAPRPQPRTLGAGTGARAHDSGPRGRRRARLPARKRRCDRGPVGPVAPLPPD
ncbi:hypothetical protein J1605_010971 [Eschrichtius robustus]|uniref:Uncharacterized protein n=1 Tax=Eschrichtius robustus TaxID=9764 RepID=A0AB34GNS5_ESCRO|nr:hypothetical protein J1605_010971 [Eschrichtius robustus]